MRSDATNARLELKTSVRERELSRAFNAPVNGQSLVRDQSLESARTPASRFRSGASSRAVREPRRQTHGATRRWRLEAASRRSEDTVRRKRVLQTAARAPFGLNLNRLRALAARVSARHVAV